MGRSPNRGVGDAAALAGVVTRLRRALRSSVRSEIPWERLPMAQVELLQRLQEEPGLRIGELAARQHLATNTVSSLVQQMVENRLVERRPDPGDRRALVVEPTAAGLLALHDWQEINARRIDSALNELVPAERESLTQSLPALARLVEVLESQGSELPSRTIQSPNNSPGPQ